MKNPDDDHIINIGTIFKGLDKFINIVADMVENEKEMLNIEGNINNTERDKRVVGKYGINIKIGGEKIGGLKDINTLGKIKSNSQIEKVASKTLEPVTDIFEEDKEIIIVAELPGIAEEDIELYIEGEILKITAEGSENLYSKNIKLPFAPRMEMIKPKLSNSIYSIVISKDSQ